MAYGPLVRCRKTIRLQGYDYTQPNAYFVTIVAYRRKCVFGEIVDGMMRLNEWGKTIPECWSAIPDHYCAVLVDEFAVMPNHIHGIMIICEKNIKPVHPVVVGATQWVAPTKPGSHTENKMRGGKNIIVSNSIGSMLGQFKSAATKRIRPSGDTPGAPIWQRNYWEHIIRDQNELGRIREYFRNNPLPWDSDVENGGQSTGYRGY